MSRTHTNKKKLIDIQTPLIIYHNQSLLTETVTRGNNQISDTNQCGGKLINVSEVCEKSFKKV
jgi:hypothetical protein